MGSGGAGWGAGRQVAGCRKYLLGSCYAYAAWLDGDTD